MRAAVRNSAKDGGGQNCADGSNSTARDRMAIESLYLKQPNPFLFVPRRSAASAMAADIGAIEIKKLRFEGVVVSTGTSDWLLTGRLGATVVQECVVSLAPVKTRLDAKVARNFTTEEAAGTTRSYAPVPDLDIEVVEGSIDLAAVAREALLLELPTYPKIEGAEAELSNFPGGTEPEFHEDGRRPFASLSELRNRLCD